MELTTNHFCCSVTQFNSFHKCSPILSNILEGQQLTTFHNEQAWRILEKLAHLQQENSKCSSK